MKSKTTTAARITKVIIALHASPNNSTQRAALWAKLVTMRSNLK